MLCEHANLKALFPSYSFVEVRGSWMNWELMQTTAKGGLVKYLGKLELSVLGMLYSV